MVSLIFIWLGTLGLMYSVIGFVNGFKRRTLLEVAEIAGYLLIGSLEGFFWWFLSR